MLSAEPIRLVPAFRQVHLKIDRPFLRNDKDHEPDFIFKNFKSNLLACEV